jgi:hypothetical protein
MRFAELRAEWLLEILKSNLEHLKSFSSDDASVLELKKSIRKRVSEIERHATAQVSKHA